MSLHGPMRAPGTCLDGLCSPAQPAAQAVVAGPLPQRQNPQRSFAAANVRKCSSAEHPPQPSPRPHPHGPTPDCGDLGHPGRSRGLEEGLPARLSRGWRRRPGAAATAPLALGHQGRRAPSPPVRACPRAPLRASPLLDSRGHPTYPAAQGPGLGPGACVTSG